MKFKIIIFLFAVAANVLTAQNKAPQNWFNLDKSADNVQGVSTEKTYQELLNGKKSTTVVVAVLDSGVDPEHEDLKDVMWVNPGEIPGNGIDDDKNGYADDVHGWNFIGGKNGQSVVYDVFEGARLYGKLKTKYENADASKLSGKDKKEYELYETLKKDVEEHQNTALSGLAEIEGLEKLVTSALDAIVVKLGKQAPTKENIDNIDAGSDKDLVVGKNILLKMLKDGEKIESIQQVKADLMQELNEGKADYEVTLKYQYNPEYNPRKEIIGDDYENVNQRDYGNNDVKGPQASHGTHVAGIIGASRGNKTGIKGVADDVRIMSVRIVPPEGDERDKDVANAIIYAVDNGASVLNMSFGKGYAYNKKAVDDAVKYAAKHDVLLVHAAGNSSKNNDNTDNFPRAAYEKGGKAKNWLEVGALHWKTGENSVANFSNYGKKTVDLFSPGVQIYSTTPDQGYQDMSGTSMASPVAAGVAAMIRSYYPTLTAKQVKKAMMAGVEVQTQKVKKPGATDKVSFKELCKTGGVVNTYKAVEAASKMKGKRSTPIGSDANAKSGRGAGA